jgi:hypothetical protein
MLSVFTSSKGGSGTTVTACACALQSASLTGSALLIDFCGDVPAALGLAENTAPGINDWLAEEQTADGEALMLLGTATGQGLIVVHRGSKFVEGQPRWADLAKVLSSLPMPVFIDAGNAYLPEELRTVSQNIILVTRACYLALRRATASPKPTSIVVIEEQGRALTARDVEHVIGVPVIAQIPIEAKISRAVDAGLFVTRYEQVISQFLPELN